LVRPLHAKAEHAKKAQAMRSLCANVVAMAAAAQLETLVAMTVSSAAQRYKAFRVATFFSCWRHLCFNELPPVLRELMRVRRRMMASR